MDSHLKKYLTLIGLFLIGISLIGCNNQDNPPLEETITLTDLSGKTQTEIKTLFENLGMTINFREVASSEVNEGEFIRYIGFNIGDEVSKETTIRVEIAVAIASAPMIFGAENAIVYAAVQGNPPSFDITEGVTAKDYKGNDIPFGQFLYILSIKDKTGEIVGAVNFYQVGDYEVTYVAQNSGFTTTVVRTISVTVPAFDTNHTDSLRLDKPYNGKSFINDGIGVVTLSSHTDADTTNFRDPITGLRFAVRYLGIDAPEATSKFDPWGIKAADFVRQTLDTADEIILEAEGERTDGNNRYLAWVWYVKDGQTRLLNLELVEQAYAFGKAAEVTQYGSVFTVAAAETQLTGKRIYGEEDPDYDYSREGTPISINDLIINFSEYNGKKVLVSGVVTAKVSNSIFLEKDGVGIYVYTGAGTLTNELQIGYEVTIQGLVATYYNDSLQLTNYSMNNMILVSTDNVVQIHAIDGSQMADYYGRVVRIDNLTVKSVGLSQSNSPTDAYTVYAEDEFKNPVTIRVDRYTAQLVPSYEFQINMTFSITAPVTRYYESYQLMLPGKASIILSE